jgi:phosphate transport system substrate-binding protein
MNRLLLRLIALLALAAAPARATVVLNGAGATFPFPLYATADFRASITDAVAPDAYPIASFTWLLVPSRIPDRSKGQALKRLLEWMLSDGQALAPSLLYAPLPEYVATLERQALANVQLGQP